MNKIIRLLVIALSIFILTGCGNSEPAIKADTAPFEKAIAAYCRSRGYGMKVKKFVSLKVEAGKADAVAKMEVDSGIYGLSVKWEFKFQKQADAEWKALSHTVK